MWFRGPLVASVSQALILAARHGWTRVRAVDRGQFALVDLPMLLA
jgi:hypothetical protein